MIDPTYRRNTVTITDAKTHKLLAVVSPDKAAAALTHFTERAFDLFVSTTNDPTTITRTTSPRLLKHLIALHA
jgi:hypothetical protein|tara:strand:+ start:1525 stop:1743 length:219 start_codon:yes stop_codon:yes gene_type:complete